MIKGNLVICVILGLLLSGCSTESQNSINNKNEKITKDSKSIVNNDSKDEPKEQTESEVIVEGKLEPIFIPVEDSTDIPEKNVSENSTPKKQEEFVPLTVQDVSTLSTQPISWSWLYSSRDSADLLSKYQGYGFGDTSKKIIYLTFDEGYENGYTASILDTLKANNVQATFFVTEPYVTSSYNGVPNSELLKRMMSEGHLIGNHSVNHKSMPTFTNEASFNAELTGVENAVNSIQGCKMSKYFRPPEGTFSELSLYYTQKLGYKSIFFSLAYKDYDVNNQPNPEVSKTTLIQNTKDGTICLLHAVSKTNATILDSLIKEWKNQGYEFKSLDELPSR